VISKLRGVCRTQLRDHLRGLEIIWQFKMSKLLNLSAYSLACLLPCTNWDISCICQCLAKHVSQIIVAHFEMISIFYIHACLAWYWSPYACGDFAQIATSLNFISISLLHVCYLLMVYLWGLTLIFFSKWWHLDEYSCVKYLLLKSVKHPNFDLMHCIYFSGFVFDEFIAKGGENVNIVVELIANWVVERSLWKICVTPAFLQQQNFVELVVH
jgi:hypothetical protein